MNQTVKLALLALLFVSSTFAQEVEQQEDHYYKEEDPNMLFGNFNEVDLNADGEGRMLASYPRLRITSDFTYLTEGSDEFLNYVKTEWVPAVTSYLQAALGNKYPLTSPITVSSSTLCGRDTPQALLTGVNTDLYVIFNSVIDTSGAWVAAATSCMVSTGVKRPIIITIGINAPNVKVPTSVDNPLTHDLNINVLTHEFVHGLAMNGVYYNYFVDSAGNPLVNHIKKITLSGTQRTVLDLPPLTTRLRKFYGCTTVPGFFMEQGSAHAEGRFFQWDIMATGGVIGSKITQFTLGFLEGSGWYVPDYTYAEPYFFGQGQGCTFYKDNLAASAMDDYCTGTGMGCTEIGDSGGYCVGPSNLEGYRVITAQPLLNCENPVGVYYTPYANKQVYGRGMGSKCFTGNLSGSKEVSQTSYCLKYTCTGTGTSTQLLLSWGSTTLTCTKKGPLSIEGYVGSINCPDPLAYCKTTGALTCRRNCMGRGKCVSGQCICKTGFKGTDCGFTN